MSGKPHGIPREWGSRALEEQGLIKISSRFSLCWQQADLEGLGRAEDTVRRGQPRVVEMFF
jgi:hypothetical protein